LVQHDYFTNGFIASFRFLITENSNTQTLDFQIIGY
jgi:hypothetical protein